jgi:hypothetical protein
MLDSLQRTRATVTPPATLILGMHRSGTSCLAGSLQQRGLFLGEVYESRPHNRKGSRENQRIMDLNNAVLESSGGAWDRPPGTLGWNDAARRERDAVIAGLASGSNGAPWGFKDPRTLLLLPFWLEGLGRARWVGTFRHPAQVARSLTTRDPSMAWEAALDLWLAYNQRLLALFDRAAFPLVDFDAPADAYLAAVEAVARVLALPGAAAGGEFFETGLRTAGLPAGGAVPDAHLALHAALRAAAGRWQ